MTTAEFSCGKELKNGDVVQILSDWEIGTIDGHAVLAGGKKAKPSARAFVDYMVQSFRQEL